MAANRKLDFCERLVYLQGKLIRFDGRPYLPAIYGVTDRNLVLRCSRQVEKSTFLVNTILFEACRQPGLQMLLVCPRREQARGFSRTRLLPAIEQSPLIRRTLLGRRKRQMPVMNMEFKNGSCLFIRAAYKSADACRGLSAQLLLVDEFQDIAAGDYPVLREILSHASDGRTVLVGTPKSVENHLEAYFSISTAREWQIFCPQCRGGVALDERCLGPHGVTCPVCHTQLDCQKAQWITRNPAASWGEGFCINHLMVPWLNYDDVLERQRSYDLVRFKNEVLGLPSVTGDQVVSRAELEACCLGVPFARSLADIPREGQGRLVAGIDWGGGGTSRTVLVIGFMRSDFVFQVCRFDRFNSQDDPESVLNQIAQYCQAFQVRWIAADGGGNGNVQNRLLVARLGAHRDLHAIYYSMTDHEPKREGVLTKWTVNRSASIGLLIGRIKRKSMLFPRLAESGSYLDEFACEIAEFDDINRTTKYTHPATLQDDALHATNYALVIATLTFNRIYTQQSEDE